MLIASLALGGAPASPQEEAPDPYHKAYDNFQKKQFAACAEEAEKAVEASPEDYDRLYLLGVCHTKASHWDKAISPLKKAAALKESSFDAWSLVAQAYLKLPKPDVKQAQAALKRAVELAPERHELQYLLGITSLQAGQYRTAIDALSATLKAQPDHKLATRDLGVAYLKEGDANKAAEMLTKAVALFPADCTLIQFLVLAQRKLDQHAAALRTLEPCLEQGGQKDLLFLAGSSAVLAAQHEKAIGLLEQAVAVDPKNHAAFGYLGQAFERLARHDRALEAYQKALELARGNGVPKGDLVDYLYRTAHAYHLLQRYEEAIKHYDETLKLDPKHAAAADWKRKAQERLEQQRLQE